jgi:hypothetical protein
LRENHRNIINEQLGFSAATATVRLRAYTSVPSCR